MLATATARIDELISDSLRQTDEANLREEYCEQDEFVVVEDFLSPEVLSRWEVELEKLKPHIHRNYLPGHKKGGSAAYQTVNALALKTYVESDAELKAVGGPAYLAGLLAAHSPAALAAFAASLGSRARSRGDVLHHIGSGARTCAAAGQEVGGDA
jgi:hypothetical protein